MSGKQRWSIRPGLPADRDILERMIYEALYWQPDAVRETFDFVIAHPEISRYVAEWGRPGDSAVVAESLDGRQQVGAAWYRLFSADLPGYGFVSPEVPEVAIAVEQGFRGLGIGRALMEALIERAQSDRQPGLSLSVELANVAALGLYQRLGFVPVGGDEHNHTMLLSLDGQEFGRSGKMMPPTGSGIAGFLKLAIHLKQIRRQGWVDRGVQSPESVADHSWSVALLGWLLAADRPDLDRERVLLLGIIHDLPEAVAGDATPFDRHRDESGQIDPALFLEAPGYPADERNLKQQREKEALEQMLAGGPAGLAADIRAAWSEYEANSTPEARFVKQVDKLETAMQALAYRHDDPRLVVDSFLRGAERDIADSALAQLLDELIDER